MLFQSRLFSQLFFKIENVDILTDCYSDTKSSKVAALNVTSIETHKQTIKHTNKQNFLVYNISVYRIIDKYRQDTLVRVPSLLNLQIVYFDYCKFP